VENVIQWILHRVHHSILKCDADSTHLDKLVLYQCVDFALLYIRVEAEYVLLALWQRSESKMIFLDFAIGGRWRNIRPIPTNYISMCCLQCILVYSAIYFATLLLELFSDCDFRKSAANQCQTSLEIWNWWTISLDWHHGRRWCMVFDGFPTNTHSKYGQSESAIRCTRLAHGFGVIVGRCPNGTSWIIEIHQLNKMLSNKLSI
jgi:hypothetical protein